MIIASVFFDQQAGEKLCHIAWVQDRDRAASVLTHLEPVRIAIRIEPGHVNQTAIFAKILEEPSVAGLRISAIVNRLQIGLKREGEAARFQMCIGDIGEGASLFAVAPFTQAVLGRPHTGRQAQTRKPCAQGRGRRDHFGINRCITNGLDIDEVCRFHPHAGGARHRPRANDVLNRCPCPADRACNEAPGNRQSDCGAPGADRGGVIGQNINSAQDTIDLAMVARRWVGAIIVLRDLGDCFAEDLVACRGDRNRDAGSKGPTCKAEGDSVCCTVNGGDIICIHGDRVCIDHRVRPTDPGNRLTGNQVDRGDPTCRTRNTDNTHRQSASTGKDRGIDLAAALGLYKKCAHFAAGSSPKTGIHHFCKGLPTSCELAACGVIANIVFRNRDTDAHADPNRTCPDRQSGCEH